MISHVKSYALKCIVLENFISQANSQERLTLQKLILHVRDFFSSLGLVQAAIRCLSQALPWLPEHNLEI